MTSYFVLISKFHKLYKTINSNDSKFTTSSKVMKLLKHKKVRYKTGDGSHSLKKFECGSKSEIHLN